MQDTLKDQLWCSRRGSHDRQRQPKADFRLTRQMLLKLGLNLTQWVNFSPTVDSYSEGFKFRVRWPFSPIDITTATVNCWSFYTFTVIEGWGGDEQLLCREDVFVRRVLLQIWRRLHYRQSLGAETWHCSCGLLVVWSNRILLLCFVRVCTCVNVHFTWPRLVIQVQIACNTGWKKKRRVSSSQDWEMQVLEHKIHVKDNYRKL